MTEKWKRGDIEKDVLTRCWLGRVAPDREIHWKTLVILRRMPRSKEGVSLLTLFLRWLEVPDAILISDRPSPHSHHRGCLV